MSRSTLPYLLLVLLPTVALAVFAFRAADRDHEEGLATHRARLAEEADALGRRIESAVGDAARQAEGCLEDRRPGAVIGYAREGEWLGYAPEPPEERDPSPLADEARLGALSLAGGESFELVQKDPARALDAYTFYLPRIRSPALRARLLFRAARAGLAAGDHRLAASLFGNLLDGGAGAASEEGLPLALLAALRLRELPEGQTETWFEKLRGALVKHQASIPTALLARLTQEHFPDEPGLARLVEERRALEAAIRRRPEVLGERAAALDERSLLLARPTGALRAIAHAPVELPRLAAGDFEARLEYSPAASVTAGGTGPGAIEAVRPVRLGEGGTELATLHVRDPRFGERTAALGRRRDLQRALVGLLVAATLGGGMALLRYIARERNLARLRARLLANVSHELKTPITSIRMFAEMLAEDPLDGARTRRFGEHLRVESRRLSQLIENLLDFSRLGRKDEPLPIEPVDLEALLRQAAEGFTFRAQEKGVDFRLEAGPLPALDSNAPALERILSNLLDNALKYRHREGAWIRLRAEAAEGGVRIAVADNGIGIPRADRERVFEEFYRVRYEDYAVPGSGLGLSIARRLARKLGGDIALESSPGEGSTFTLVLPRLPGKAAQ